MADEQLVPLEASIEIAAPPGRVWAVVSDLPRMGEWSPECRKMVVVGTLREGARVVGFNKRGWAMWPTNSRIVRYEPEREIAWQVLENRSTWSYELVPTDNGTLLIERRSVSDRGVPKLSALLTKAFLGGIAGHDAELLDGMHQTLGRIKAEVESP